MNAVGCGPLEEDGDFGSKTLSAVKLFQATRKDDKGQALIVDGQIGAITWAALFGSNKVNNADTATNTFLREVITVATGEIGTMESPLGSNTGPKINQYLASVNLSGGHPWCAAFIYYCAVGAAANIGRTNPLVKTGGCLAHWNNTSGRKIKVADAINNPSLVKPGSIFIMDLGNGNGHTGIVTAVNGGFIETIEGNTNNNGSREGIGVFRMIRKIKSIQKGFIIY